METTLYERLANVAKAQPMARAVDFGDAVVRYGDLVADVETTARDLRDAGFLPGDTLVFSDTVPAGYIVMFFACSAARLTLVPVPADAPASWRREVALMTNAQADLYGMTDVPGAAPLSGEAREEQASSMLLHLCAPPDAWAAKPTTVSLPEAACYSVVDRVITQLGIKSDDTILTYVPPHAPGGTHMLVVPGLLAGATVAMERFDKQAFDAVIDRCAATVTVMESGMLQVLRESNVWAAADLSHVRAVVTDDAELSGSFADELLAKDIGALYRYGYTTEDVVSLAAR